PGRVRHRQGQHQEQRRGDGLQDRGKAIDAALVEAVGHVARGQGAKEHRYELAEPDQTQRQRRAHHVVNLPADGDRLNLHGAIGNEARRHKERQVTRAVEGGGNVAHGRADLPESRHQNNGRPWPWLSSLARRSRWRGKMSARPLAAVADRWGPIKAYFTTGNTSLTSTLRSSIRG